MGVANLIGGFPDPYPEETLYSVVARYHQRMGNPVLSATARDVFGRERLLSLHMLPVEIDRLTSQLPPGHRWSSDRLIDEHTHLPLYMPFLPPDRLDLIRTRMKEGTGQVSGLLGSMQTRAKSYPFMRYCPVCVDDDNCRFGESYWHRAHQVPGVEICSVHGVYLERSEVELWGKSKALHVCNPGKRIRPRVADVSCRTTQILLAIAKDAEWLLLQRNLCPGLHWLHGRYCGLIRQKRGPFGSRRLRIGDLVQPFVEFYSDALLAKLGCEIKDVNRSTWLTAFFGLSKSGHRPLFHLLIMQFLGCSAREFFEGPVEEPYHPFGCGPWLCLNPVADHYGKPVVTACTIKRHRDKPVPIGIFRCSCGFNYGPRGPDQKPEDRLRFDWIQNHGSVWEAELRVLWMDSTLSTAAIRRKLGSSFAVVRKRAQQLGLPVRALQKAVRKVGKPQSPPAWAYRLPDLWEDPGVSLWDMCEQFGVGRNTLNRWADRVGLPVPRPKFFRSQQLDMAGHPKSLETYRSCWLEGKKMFPNYSRTQLQKALPVSNWLYKHDRVWFEEHQPPSRSRSAHRPMAKQRREQEDKELALRVQEAAQKLMSQVGRPVQITRTALAKAVGRTLFELIGYPVTTRLLNGVVEPFPRFIERRLKWAVEVFRSERVYPTKTQMMKRLGIDTKSIRNNGMIGQVEEALDQLSRMPP